MLNLKATVNGWVHIISSLRAALRIPKNRSVGWCIAVTSDRSI